LKNVSLRLIDLFGDHIELICFSDYATESETIDFRKYSAEQLNKISKCGFISSDQTNLVLVDNKNRIRGYYSRELDEIDRLIVELKIIIENDQEHGR
ncbi:MAG: hypothetical protein RLO81_13725, partial [Fulvivirga sp.]